MHLGNGAITPECAALAYGAAAVGLAASAVAIRRSGVTREKLLLAAGLGCVVFTAQAINVPVAIGTSAHLVGGVLFAWLLGPALAVWAMALVLAIQALALGDGGVAALGANVLNMAIVPALMVEVARRIEKGVVGTAHPTIVLGLTAGAAVLVAAGLIVMETALFRPAAELSGWIRFAVLMLGTHAWIGALEGALTVVLVSSLASLATPKNQLISWRPAIIGVSVALLVAALTLPISSGLPDGYEAAAEASGMGWLLGR